METSEINWNAYQAGYEAWDDYCASGWKNRPNNPHELESNDWRSWNKGWNSNYNGTTENDF